MNRYIQHLPKRFHVLIIVVVLLNVLNGSCLAANLHSILICYTDEMGRPDRDTTYERMAHTVSNIAYYAGLNHQPHHFTEYQFDYSEVVNFLQNFWCEPDATVFVLYDGHGGNVAGSDWPYWVFPTGEKLPMDWVIDTLRQKNPRLLIVLSGACNSGYGEEIVISPNRGLKSLEPVPPCYRKLFAETRGEVLGTAAPPGEVSWGDIYPNAFLDSLHSRCQESADSVTWHEVIKATHEKSVSLTQNFTSGRYAGPQHPIAQIRVGTGDTHYDFVPGTPYDRGVFYGPYPPDTWYDSPGVPYYPPSRKIVPRPPIEDETPRPRKIVPSP